MKSSHDKHNRKVSIGYYAFWMGGGGDRGSLRLKTKDFYRQMKEPDVRCHHLLLDEQPTSEPPQDWRNTPSQPISSTCKNLPLETTTTLLALGSGEACTTKVLFPANYSLVQFFRFAIAIVPVGRSRFGLVHRHERAAQ